MNPEAIERLFFALWPTEAERERLGSLAERLALLEPARRVAPQEYHVTVAFVGEVMASRVQALRRLGAVLGGGPCALHFDAYEYWPKPQVIVAVARQIPPALEAMWRELHTHLAAQGLALDPKRLRPHVTLIRGVRAAPVLAQMPGCDWAGRALCLVRSARGQGPCAYTVVDEWSLLDATPTG